MNRRGFLQGVFGGVTAAGVLVCASPEEIAAYASPMAQNDPVLLGATSKSETSVGEFAYNASGQVIGIIADVRITNHPVDATMHWDSVSHHIPGTVEVDILVKGMGPLSFDPFLRGKRL